MTSTTKTSTSSSSPATTTMTAAAAAAAAMPLSASPQHANTSQSKPSLLTGLNLTPKPPIAQELRARIEFASLKAANGLALHSLDEIEQATLEAERIETLLLEQHNRMISGTGNAGQGKAADQQGASPSQTASLAASSPVESRTAQEMIWTSPAAVLGPAAAPTPLSLNRQGPAQAAAKSRTIFDAIAARNPAQNSAPASPALLFPKVPSSSRSTRSNTSHHLREDESPGPESSRSTVKVAISAATLLHRAASIPQLGSPRRLINVRAELSDPHNEPSSETKEQEQKLAIDFEQQQRAEQQRLIAEQHHQEALARQRMLLAASTAPKRIARDASSLRAEQPASKRARFSKDAAAAGHTHYSTAWKAGLPDHSPSRPYASAANAFLSARSPASKLASSYARGVAASSAIGTGLARSPDPRSSRPNSATANASSLTFQSPRGLTLGQGLGITSRNMLSGNNTGTPLGSRKREESFERGMSSSNPSSSLLSDSPQLSEVAQSTTQSQPPERMQSVTPVQRPKPLLSPPPSSPGHRDETKAHRQMAAAGPPARRAQDELMRKTYAAPSPNPGMSVARRRPQSPISSAVRGTSSAAQDVRSPARMQPSERTPVSSKVSVVAGSSPVSQATQSAAHSKAPTQANFGLGFNFENGAPVDMPAPATPKSRAMRALAGDAGKGQRSGSVERDVDMEGSEAAQLMLFLAGSPSAPSSTRFTAGVTPSVTNLPFASLDKGANGSSGSELGSQTSGSALGASGSTAVVGVGPGSGSPGPEGRMIARMLTYGDSRAQEKKASLSPRSDTTASTPILGMGPSSATPSMGSSSTMTGHRSEDDEQRTLSLNEETTPEPSPLLADHKIDSRARETACTPPPIGNAASSARPATPPRQPPSTPNAPGSSTFSYAEFLNVSPSPQPRLRRTPRIGSGKGMNRSGSGDRPPYSSSDLARTPSRMARGRFLDFDQEIGPHSASIEHRKRFAQMVQIGEEDGADEAVHTSGSDVELVPGPIAEPLADGVTLASAFTPGQPLAGSTPIGLGALKEKSHNHSSGVLDPTAVPRSGALRARTSTGPRVGALNASPLLKPQVARPLAPPPPLRREIVVDAPADTAASACTGGAAVDAGVISTAAASSR
ncbi:hypothetical protein OC842_003072 [Tilletia horrida]|uniref:Uncharacterized protein n=1 Tax=Tilletia horrida TaxID=155126 RepID=A0AAN6GCE9_9BASI|nr:hypothetical protein OC842_003072 [Tilletia horrida]